MIGIASLHDLEPATQGNEPGIHPAYSMLNSSPWFAHAPRAALVTMSMAASIRSFGARQLVVMEGRWLGAAVLVDPGRGHQQRARVAGREAGEGGGGVDEICHLIKI